MRGSTILILVVASFASHASLAQDDAIASAARDASTMTFTRLTNPRNTPFRVGISSWNSGMLISPKGVNPVAQFIYSEQGDFAAEAMLQMKQEGADFLGYRVARTSLTTQNCSALSDAVAELYGQLETILSAQSSLEVMPSEADLGAFYIDFADLQIQIQLGSATLAIRFPQSGEPMQQAILRLLSRGRRCSENIEPSIDLTSGRAFNVVETVDGQPSEAN